MIVKAIKHALLSAALLASASVLVLSVPQTQAAPAASHAAMCLRPCLPPPPTLNLVGEAGFVFISGANWTPNTWIQITVYMPVSLGGNVTQMVVKSDAHGAISTDWRGGCVELKVEVQAYDPILNKVVTSYAVPGCLT